MPLIRQNLKFIFGLLLTILLSACGSENEAKDSANGSDSQPARVALIMKSLANIRFLKKQYSEIMVRLTVMLVSIMLVVVAILNI